MDERTWTALWYFTECTCSTFSFTYLYIFTAASLMTSSLKSNWGKPSDSFNVLLHNLPTSKISINFQIEDLVTTPKTWYWNLDWLFFRLLMKGIFDPFSPVHVLLSRFYLDFILFLSWFHPNIIQIKSG